MANIQLDHDVSLLGELVGGSQTLSAATEFAYTSNAGATIKALGVGFSYDASQIPTGGTVTGLEVSLGGDVYLTVTGMSIPLTTFCTLSLGLTSGEPNKGDPDFDALSVLMFNGADSFHGDVSDNRFDGQAGNDTLFGNGGHDTLLGGAGNDRLLGGAGDDWLIGGLGVDRYFGGTGTNGMVFDTAMHAISIDLSKLANNILDDGFGDVETATNVTKVDATNFADRIIGDGKDNDIWCHDGNDTVLGGGGADFAYGGAGADQLTGDAGNDELDGGDGNDRVSGGDGNDWLAGGAGVDRFLGGTGVDGIFFGSDATVNQGISVDLSRTVGQIRNDGHGNIETATGVEKLDGSNLADSLIGSADDNFLFGEGGADTLTGGDGNDVLNGGSGNDSLSGGSGIDEIYGGDGDDRLSGGSNNDYIVGGSGVDRFFGGIGRADEISFFDQASASHGVRVNLNRTSGQILDDGFGNVETATGIEVLDGSGFADTLTGGTGNETLYGNEGIDRLIGGFGRDYLYGGGDADFLFGGSGNDSLNGFAGSDQLTGGADFDHFFLLGALADHGLTTITDMTHGGDRIHIDAAWGGGFTSRVLSTAQFLSGAGVTEAALSSQRIVYDTTTGNLYFDVDGKDGAAAVLIANLSNLEAITRQDFDVVL